MKTSILQSMQAAKSQKQLAILIDPDSLKLKHLDRLIKQLQKVSVDYLLVGGSLILDDQLHVCIQQLKSAIALPIVIFPGSPLQISSEADGILFLSLISGRNPEYLIGNQVIAAPYIRAANLEVMSTGYMLIDGGKPTTASYMSNAMPIPRDKNEIAVCTAMAGEMLGLRTIYMDAGSGAQQAVPSEMIRAVAAQIQVPLIVGGGIRTPQKAIAQLEAGADIIVVGTSIEKDPGLLLDLAQAVKSV
ncbi:MAG: geranylgeranylglyceryl/heptaprenylglyceryl phosphate synthase [Bacteroidota bacterium]